MPLVKEIVRHYCSRVEAAELEQVGYLALVEAATQHDYGSGQRFCVTASYAVRQAVRKELRRSGSIVLPAPVQTALTKLHQATACFEQQYGYAPTADELAVCSQVAN